MESKKEKIEEKEVTLKEKKEKSPSEEEKVNVQPTRFPSLKPQSSGSGTNNIELLFDIPLQLTAEEVLQLTTGSVIELDKLTGEPAELLINGKLIAKGEVVVVDENFGLRITEIIRPEARLRKLE